MRSTKKRFIEIGSCYCPSPSPHIRISFQEASHQSLFLLDLWSDRVLKRHEWLAKGFGKNLLIFRRHGERSNRVVMSH